MMDDAVTPWAESAEGYPLYRVSYQVEPHEANGDGDEWPVENEPGGIAARSTGAAPPELVEMVVAGERPATTFGGPPHEAVAEVAAALRRAEEAGLFIALYCVNGYSPDYVVGVDEAAALRVLDAYSEPRTLEHDVLCGRALGYSESDIMRFCERTRALFFPARSPKAVAAALASGQEERV